MDNSNVATLQPQSVHWLDKLAKKALFAILSKLNEAGLTIDDGIDVMHFGDANAELQAKIEIHHSRVWRQLLLGGSIAAGESYIQGDWTSPDLTKVIQVLGRNLTVLDKLEKRFAWLSSLRHLKVHKSNRNSEHGSKKNILAHYDLGNDMYRTFLDKEMLYSSAIYPSKEADLEAAQLHKLHLICERLELKPGETLLEIGTGWGGLAIYAAQHYGVKVTTTTISDAQYDYACARVAELGLQDKITLLKQDYRKLEGQYDKLVSIEMIEAVGHEYLETFFRTCSDRLKPSGKMLIQAITIADQRYDSYRTGVDFIQRYIFPGGCLPSVSVMSHHIADKTDMVMMQLHDIGLDYARTLKDWLHRFEHSLADIRQQGYGEDFIRLWKFYLCYCEGGFLERSISTVHLVAAKPDFRSPDYVTYHH